MRHALVSQEQLDKLWQVYRENPNWKIWRVAETAGVHPATAATILRIKRRKAFRGKSCASGMWGTEVLRPAHAKSEQFSAEWWKQCDEAFCKAMRAALMEAAE